MNKDNNHIESLSPEIIEQYLRGELSHSAMHKVEKLMLNSDFEADAMEGFENINPEDIQKDIDTLNKRLHVKIDKPNERGILFYLKIAASILLVAVSFLLVTKYLGPTNNEITQVEKDSALSEKQHADKLKNQPTVPSDEKDLIAENTPEGHDETATSEGSADLIAENDPTATVPKETLPPGSPADHEQKPMESIALAEMQQNEVTSKAEAEKSSTQIMADEALAGVKVESEPSSGQKVVSRMKAAKRAPLAASPNERDISKTKITGKVISADDGKPLPGVNVVVEGTTTGTVTNIEGNYSISIPEDADSTLVFSFIGLASTNVDASGKRILDVEMTNDVAELSEVVVTGYSNEEDIYESTFEPARPTVNKSDYKDYLEANIRYPANQSKKGRVIIKFKVGEDGSLSNFEINRSMGDAFDNEAIRLIKAGPKWHAAKRDDQPVEDVVKVRVRFEPR